MLIQMPRASRNQPRSLNGDDCNPFEAALRRDLASAPVISYDATLGGWSKRVVDFALALASAPVWLPLMLVVALWSKLRHPALVFQAQERVGYGGRLFRCFSLRVRRPTAKIERLRPPGAPEQAPANDLDASGDKTDARAWSGAFERLPMLFNVLAGDMALVGPTPLSPEQLEPLKSARRYYLSARPGVTGVSAIADADEEESSQYKIYALSWSLSTDALILWEAVGALLRPAGGLKLSFRLAKARADAARM